MMLGTNNLHRMLVGINLPCVYIFPLHLYSRYSPAKSRVSIVYALGWDAQTAQTLTSSAPCRVFVHQKAALDALYSIIDEPQVLKCAASGLFDESIVKSGRKYWSNAHVRAQSISFEYFFATHILCFECRASIAEIQSIEMQGTFFKYPIYVRLVQVFANM